MEALVIMHLVRESDPKRTLCTGAEWSRPNLPAGTAVQQCLLCLQNATQPWYGSARSLTVGSTDETRAPETEAARLGLATTRALLEEILARGEREIYYTELGTEMAIGARSLLQTLPGSMLDYRTVDGG